jgi:cell division protein FtsW (lipid II flippase)
VVVVLVVVKVLKPIQHLAETDHKDWVPVGAEEADQVDILKLVVMVVVEELLSDMQLQQQILQRQLVVTLVFTIIKLFIPLRTLEHLPQHQTGLQPLLSML